MTRIALSGSELPSTDETQSVHRICDDPVLQWERWWTRASEWVNPILVKEIRQSLKSQEFVVSFSLTLIAAVAWTFIAVSLMVPRIYFIPGGLPLLVGFFVILQIPLMIIIPFSAYRSLTSETEDSTFELLSISTLSARQIIGGKMVTSLLQIVLYLSALAPCIVLTYLLRGVSLFMVLFVLCLTVSFSVGLVAVSLLLAAISRTRIVQSSVSVLLLVGLVLATWGWSFLLVEESFIAEFDSPIAGMYIGLFAYLTILCAAIALVLQAAASAIDFASENKATPIRLRILVFALVIFFWASLACGAERSLIPWQIILFGYAIFLAFVGGLMCGERGVISPRARRSLPKSFFERAIFTWLNPGGGMGYMFVVCMYAALACVLSAMELYAYSRPDFRGNSNDVSLTMTSFTALFYLAIYLGVNRLIMLKAAPLMHARMIGSCALLVVILLLAHLLPMIIVFYFNNYQEFPYAWHQALNVPWTMAEMMDHGWTPETSLNLALLTLAALVVFGLNLVSLSSDVLIVRISAPPRVEAELHPVTPKVVVDPFSD